MTPTDQTSPRFPLRRNASLLVGLYVICAAAAATLLNLLNRADQMDVALICGGVCLIASLAALWPMGRMAARGTDRIVPGAMIGMMVRLFGSLAVVVLVVLIAEFEARLAAWWTLGWYALFLAAEVWIMVNYLRPRQLSASAENAAC